MLLTIWLYLWAGVLACQGLLFFVFSEIILPVVDFLEKKGILLPMSSAQIHPKNSKHTSYNA